MRYVINLLYILLQYLRFENALLLTVKFLNMNPNSYLKLDFVFTNIQVFNFIISEQIF